MAPAPVGHVFNHLLAHVEHAVEGSGQDGAPVVERQLAQAAVARDSGVVHQHIDPAQLAEQVRHGRRAGIWSVRSSLQAMKR
jgi:hypothetical protein